ncbi:MAG TPA: HemK/PrmC family methyltransferase [Candidatus Saccharimonadales bacterium]|nr:HemK/PrmC family methyltransferase [Candidatus Saccharimonadales bacterium]
MKLDEYFKSATKRLSGSGIGSSRLDVLILLEDALHKDRSWILAHPEAKLTASQLNKLEKQLDRRQKHEPIAYIRGFTEFYGRRFKVNRRVLEPRPESEAMIDLLKEITTTYHLPSTIAVADIGTGSGALGITAALELHNHNVDLYDIDASALAVAKHNCELHELRLKAAKRDLLRYSHKPYDVILANLPYVPNGWKINEAAAMEPRIAIFGGNDGLDVYRRLFEQLSHFSWKPIFVLTEALPPQHEKLAIIAAEKGLRLKSSRGFIQVFGRAK